VLARLGDPRPGVCTLPPPMIELAGGSFVLGSSREEAQEANAQYQKQYGQKGDVATREINTQSVLIAAFELARYPVTNAQYEQFIAADGYNPDAPWWDEAGRAWLSRDDQVTEGLKSWKIRTTKRQPEYWERTSFGKARANYPVVGIGWYEATAFCCWLTQHQGYNPQGFRYTLPSEVEWEFAARGVDRRIYPWGNQEPDDERANFQNIYEGTSAVGCFPLGATPDTRLLDMAGNVWEWTRSEFRDYPYDPNDGREDERDPAQKLFILRGASWHTLPIYLRAASRDHYSPVPRYFHLGFRLARHLPL